MKCLHCHGELRRGKAPFQIDKKGYHLTLEAVPAWLCDQCGEAYFEEASVQLIQDVILSLDRKTETMECPSAPPP